MRDRRTSYCSDPARSARHRRAGVFEIDDGILFAVEIGFVKKTSGAMQQAGKNEAGVFTDAVAIEAGEERGGAGSVETLVVVKNSDFQGMPQLKKFPPSQKPCSRSLSEGGGKS
jgi:hypothetical protein